MCCAPFAPGRTPRQAFGHHRAFLVQVCETVIAENRDAFPELFDNQA